MKRYFVFLAAWISLFLIAPHAGAQEQAPSIPPVERKQADEDVYELEVDPMDEPAPPKRYRLFPEITEQVRGNAATQYYKAFVTEGRGIQDDPDFQALHKGSDEPTHKLDTKQLQNSIQQLSHFFDHFRAATYRSDCDWELHIREEGGHLLLPELSALREAGRVLATKAQVEILQGDRRQAIETARDAFMLARRMQEGDLVIVSLNGSVIMNMLRDRVFLEWISSPQCPNLYWAFSEVSGNFDVSRLVANELQLTEYSLPAARELPTRVLSPEEAADLAYRAWSLGRFGYEPIGKEDIRERVGVTLWAALNYQQSRENLWGSGYSADFLDKLPIAQVALLDRWTQYLAHREVVRRWTALLFDGTAEAKLEATSRAWRKAREGAEPFTEFLPVAFEPLRSSLNRDRRRWAALRVIEALRLYAARHNNQWPRKLADITEVPVPEDPATGRPFEYEYAGSRVTLTLVQAGGELKREYRIRMRKR